MARLFSSTPPRLHWSLSRWQQMLQRHWYHSAHPQALTRDRSNDAIIACNVDKIFNAEQVYPCHALTDVNFTIPSGSVQILMGPSGAGKTTLLLCLAGLLLPTTGKITVLGRCLNELSSAQLEQFRRQHIGMVFQESNLLRSLTALENVEAMLQFRGVYGHAAHRQARELLDAVGLHTHLNHLPRHLSGGQQQRVSVARALAGYPPIILADEPTASLDSKTGCKVVEFMRHMAKDHGCTVIITTHDTRILDVGDRVYHLHDGHLHGGQFEGAHLCDSRANKSILPEFKVSS
ncbi:MAG: ABC transporter ATP-binding protein [Cyanobacteria bacterium P01_F01_bin.150]